VLRIVRDVLSYEPVGRSTDLADALKYANEVSDRRGIVFLLSDFQTPNRSIDAIADLRLALRQVNRRHDLIALPIEDPRERVLPELGIIAIEDAETGEIIEIDTANPAVREGFREIAQQRAEQLQKIFNREAIDSLRLSTDRPSVADLMAFFKNRTRKRS
jgi:uncharacterized protein (DUF58 family)